MYYALSPYIKIILIKYFNPLNCFVDNSSIAKASSDFFINKGVRI